jgi:hypothetical protein
MRNKLPIALSLAALVVALLGAVPVAQSHGVFHAIFAHRAGAVDGKSAVGPGATLNRAAGKLVATKARGTDRGKFLKKFIPKVDSAVNADNAGTLDGLDSSAFARATQIQFASKTSENVTSVDPAWEEVVAHTLNLPDGCTGADNWNVLVSASGYLTDPSVSLLARLGLSVNSTTDNQAGTLTNATLAPGDDANEVWAVHWLFTVDSGSHVFRVIAQSFAGGTFTSFWNRMSIQVLGNGCGGGVAGRTWSGPSVTRGGPNG